MHPHPTVMQHVAVRTAWMDNSFFFLSFSHHDLLFHQLNALYINADLQKSKEQSWQTLKHILLEQAEDVVFANVMTQVH